MKNVIQKMFGPKLAEHIPGERRVYKNIFGKTVRTIERTEERIENIQPTKLSKFVDDMDKAGIKPDVLTSLDAITSTGKPIDAVSFIATDRNGYIERANATLKSGEASMRYRSTFFNGELDSMSLDKIY